MVVPKYVHSFMARARFDFDAPGCNPGYSIRVIKESPYTKIGTFRAELERVLSWARRNYADAEIQECPKETHYCRQSAVIMITDPVMQHLEQYMK